MSAFSEYLTNLVEERNVKVASLYKYCGVDRSTMYQYIKGKRKVPASLDLVEKIAEFFHLTPVEYEKFKEAYFIARIGEEVYYRRKSVENFIDQFPNPLLKLSHLKPLEKEELLSWKEDKVMHSMALTTQVELNQCLNRILLEESVKENGKIGLFLQADYSFLFDLLSSLKPAHSLQMTHILCMSSTEQRNEQNELYSLEYLKMMLPLYVADLNYQSYYFYDDIHAHFHNLNGFPCLILTSEYAITCMSDYQMGILYENPDVVSMLWDLFTSYQRRCAKLIETEKLLPENLQALRRLDRKSNSCYVLQPEPCLIPFISEEILRNAWNLEMSDNEEMLPLILKLLTDSKEILELPDTHICFTKKGLDQFIRTGKVKEIPDMYAAPFSMEDREKILQSMLPCCRSGKYRFLNIHDQIRNGEIPANFHLCVNGSLCYFLFTNISNETVRLLIGEQGLLEAFEDYLENLDETYFLPVQEAAELVEEAVKMLSLEKEG